MPGSSPGGGAWPDTSGDLVTVYKQFTFSAVTGFGLNGGSALSFFTIGGPSTTNGVIVERIGGIPTTDLAGATSTLALGVVGSTSIFIGATTCTNITAGKVWASTTPTTGALAQPTATQATIICANIIGTVATADITAGVMWLYCQYRPANPGAYLKAA